MSKKFTLFVLLALVGSLFLTACKKKEVEVTRVAKETQVKKETVVETLVEKETVVETLVEKETVVVEETVVETLIETVIVQETATVQETAGETATVQETATVEKLVETVVKVEVAEPGEPVTLRVGLTYIIDSINPHNFWYGWTVRWLWYDTPVQLEEIGDFEPALAESWEVSDDELVWTFNIREGVTFHDGTPCDAEAIAWSMNYMYQVENTPVAYLWNFDWTPIVSIQAVDTYKLQITTSEPVGNMEYRLYYAFILPKSVWESMDTAAEAKAFDDVRACMGTGAYQCVEWVLDERLVLKAYENHWRGKPPIDTIILQQYASEDALVEALLAGEVDAIYAPGAAVDALEADPNVEVLIAEGVEWDKLVINSTEPCATDQASTAQDPCGTQPASLGDPIVREAMDYALDRERIIAAGYSGYASPAGSIIPPAQGAYHNPAVKPTPLDPVYAISLLDDAGYLDSDGDGVREWSDGSPLEYRLLASDSTLYAHLAELVQEDLESIGIATNIELLSDISARLAPAWDFDLRYMSYGSDVDPDFALSAIQCAERYQWGWNYSGYCSTQGDAYYRASTTTIDRDERIKVVHAAQEFIYNERPWLMLAYTNTIAAWRSDRFVNQGIRDADILYVLNILRLAAVQ